MEKRKKLIGAKRTHRGRLEVRSLWAEHETIALINSCVMMGYSDLGKYVHDLAAGTLTEMLKQALEKKKNENPLPIRRDGTDSGVKTASEEQE